MFGIGMPELILILVVALIVIGPKKLPEVARTVGRGYREFQRAITGVRDEMDDLEKTIKKDIDTIPDVTTAASEEKKDVADEKVKPE